MLGVSLSEHPKWGPAGALFLGGLAFIGPQFVAFAAMPLIALSMPSTNLEAFGGHALYQLLSILLIVAFVNGYGNTLKVIGLGRLQNAHAIKALLGFGVYVVLTMVTMLVIDSIMHIQDEPQPLGFASPHGLELLFVFISLVILAWKSLPTVAPNPLNVSTVN